MTFKDLEGLLVELRAVAPDGTLTHFASEQFLSFITVAGTIRDSFPDTQASPEQRTLTHIWLRSSLEIYFWMLYIFDGTNKTQWESRYSEFQTSFKTEYNKMYAEQALPYKSQLKPPDPSWASLPATLDMKSLLMRVRNIDGDRLDYLYFTYRISSFDTHGKTLLSLGLKAFGTKVNFPVLRLREVIDFIADEYCSIWQKLKIIV